MAHRRFGSALRCILRHFVYGSGGRNWTPDLRLDGSSTLCFGACLLRQLRRANPSPSRAVIPSSCNKVASPGSITSWSAINLGDIQRYVNQWSQAISIYQNAIKLAEQAKRPDYLASRAGYGDAAGGWFLYLLEAGIWSRGWLRRGLVGLAEQLRGDRICSGCCG